MPEVTLEHIARQANVSIASVSKALSGDPQISEATRKRVCEISRELNYKPRRRLRRPSPRVRRVALAISEMVHYESASTPMVSTFTQSCMSQGIGVEFLSFMQDATDDLVSRMRELSRDVDGILLYGAVERNTLARLADIELPCVVIGLVSGDPLEPIPYGVQVACDVQAIGELAPRTLIKAGHQRIGLYYSSAPRGLFFDQWLQGYLRAHHFAGLKVEPELFKPLGVNERMRIGARAADAVLAMSNPPTGHLFPDTLTAAMFIESMRIAGRIIEPSSVVVGGIKGQARSFHLDSYFQVVEDTVLVTEVAVNVLSEISSGREYPSGMRINVPFHVQNLPV